MTGGRGYCPAASWPVRPAADAAEQVAEGIEQLAQPLTSHDRLRGQGHHLDRKYADLAVLSADYFNVDDADISRMELVLTIVGRKIVWPSAEFEGMAASFPAGARLRIRWLPQPRTVLSVHPPDRQPLRLVRGPCRSRPLAVAVWRWSCRDLGRVRLTSSGDAVEACHWLCTLLVDYLR
jgi:hypothetical protein